MAKVSIIIPAYNSAAFICETLESALSQSHTDCEVILVDDGSSDDTAAIASRRGGVRVIRQENAGDSAARNTGLEQASGAFVIFLDHDDLLLREAAELHLAQMEAAEDVVMTLGANYTIDAAGNRIGVNRVPTGRFDAHDVALGRTPSFSQCMYRRSALQAIGGLRAQARSAADHDLNIRLLHGRKAGLVHDGFVMSYRLHEGQQTKSPSKLYAMHMATLRGLFGPDGECTDAALLARAERHWKRYYGKFLPPEVLRLIRRGEAARAARVAGLFLRCQPEATGSTIGFIAGKLRQGKGR